MDKLEKPENQILFVDFNQDGSCIAVGTEKGFKIYNSYPFKETFERRNLLLLNLFQISTRWRNWYSRNAL